MRGGWWLCLSIVAFFAPVHAEAQTSGVEVGWRRMLEADFDGAIASFDEAERGSLTRAELLRCLEGRAHVHFALGNEESLRAALTRLAAMAPEHRLAPESPPELRERFAEHPGRGSLTLHVTMEESDGNARFEASAVGDPGGLVRHVVVAARAGDGPWVEAEDEPLRLHVDPADALAWYGEAIGPGGAVVAHDGSRAAPRRRGMLDANAATEPGGDQPPWLAIGLGAGAALVIAAVITIVVTATTPPHTQPSPPMLP